MMNGTPDDGPAPGPRNIADPFWDLLLPLDEGRRLGFIRRLAVGYYEQWRPTREEVAFLVDVELGRPSIADLHRRAAADSPERPGDTPTHDENRRPPGPRTVPGPVLRLPLPLPLPLPGSLGQAGPPQRNTPLAAFSVDCGPLATPLRFVACGLSSAGFTVRLGERYRRTFLHYRLVSPPTRGQVRSVAIQRNSAIPPAFVADITCVPNISAPQAEEDGRIRKQAARAGVVTGSRGPWPVADGVTSISFLITAQAPLGTRQRRRPAGSLHVDLRSGAATWRSVTGHESGGDGRAVAQ